MTGAGGMLGRAVLRVAGPDAVGFTRADLDVTDAEAVRRALADVDVVVNCAAFTDVDGAESQLEEAMRVNRDGARNVARAGPRVVHVSTDYVFDGTRGTPYLPADPPNPLSVYGRTKLEGERATAEADTGHLIVRTQWLFGLGGRNFADTILGLASARDTIRVVSDQIGCPTYADHLAEVLVTLAEGDDRGIYHRAGAGQASWFDFAHYLVERAGLDCRVEPCTTDEFPRPAHRPRYAVLQTAGGERRIDADNWDLQGLPRWEAGADAYLAARGVHA